MTSLNTCNTNIFGKSLCRCNLYNNVKMISFWVRMGSKSNYGCLYKRPRKIPRKKALMKMKVEIKVIATSLRTVRIASCQQKLVGKHGTYFPPSKPPNAVVLNLSNATTFNTVPHVVVTPIIKLFSLLLHNCNFSTVNES
uniref:Uncharacterized protein n=1 Tax=Pipistrellus kuhlii TaxID=59472 RepID=A0A7J8B2M8_PIPKU|nr:hypothetical protein mPipKuh1_007903 [Pipistrellus kuhlii]